MTAKQGSAVVHAGIVVKSPPVRSEHMGLITDPRDDDWAGSDSDLPPLEQEAIDWVALLTSGKATDADHANFERWRSQSAEHEAAARSARELWVGVGQVLTHQRSEQVQAEQRARQVTRLRQPLRYVAMAASLLIAVVLGFQGLHNWRYDYVAASGEQDSISLEDGTTVSLNSGSALDVRYTVNAREVVLARGEAYFDVTHNPTLPFIVQAGNTRVRVLGTAFSVRRLDDGDDVLVTVERGRVEVRAGEGATVLRPNERVRYQGGALGGVEAANPYTELAWRRGRLIVEDQTLADVIHELNRYYPGKIVVSGDKAGSHRLNAVIDLKHIDQWLAALDESQPIEIRRVGPVVILR